MGRTLNQNNSNKGGNNSVIGTNPVIRKLSKVAEQSDNCASYGGIAVKTLYFLLMSGVGYVLYLYLSLNVFNTGESFDIEFDNYVSTLHMTPLFIGLGAAILSIILPFIVAFVRSTGSCTRHNLLSVPRRIARISFICCTSAISRGYGTCSHNNNRACTCYARNLCNR